VVFTAGHGARTADELLGMLAAAGVRTVIDVRRFPGSRRNPQFGREPLAASLSTAGIAYRHEVELGGYRHGEPGAERFACIAQAGFRSYLARMGQPAWQEALARALAEPSPCFLCAETLWRRCHRRFIAELLTARGLQVAHLLQAGRAEPHRPLEEAEYRGGRLYVCGQLVA
jgi:uncharacterized protein (DUF488 family)